MRLLVTSYKICWKDPGSPSGYVSFGGFPQQMAALSQLFDSTRLLIFERPSAPFPGTFPLVGPRLEIPALPEPFGIDARRKLNFLLASPRILWALWREISRADAVHALVPSDLGTLGLVLALLRRKPLFVRHCGTWGHRATLADRFLAWLLPRIAGGRNVVMATGAGDQPPAPDVSWIFSTTLSDGELENLPRARSWSPGEPLRLVTVGRITESKNQASAVAALPALREALPGTRLAVVGEGPALEDLEAQVRRDGLDGAVTLHGNLDHEGVMEVLGQSHLLVFPTRVAEGFPKAVIEAMACGLPVLAPRVSMLPDLLGGGEDPEGRPAGWLLDETSPQALAVAVQEAAASPQELAARGAAARRSAARFTQERWRDKVASILERSWSRPLRDSADPEGS